MKSKVFAKITFVLAALLCAVLAMGALWFGLRNRTDAQAAPEGGFDENNVVMSFGALSDVHIGYGLNDHYLVNALTQIKEQYSPDAILFAGDLTQTGIESEAHHLIRTIEKVCDPAETAIFMSYGNHDTNMFRGVDKKLDELGFYNAFYAENPDIYKYDIGDIDQIKAGNRHMRIKGSDGKNYDFVAFQYNRYGSVNAMSDETAEWLDDTLTAITAENPDRYVFVTGHAPAANTAIGTFSVATSVLGSEQADDIMKKYPQVIYLSGHTHFSLVEDLSINQTTYTQLNVGAETDLAMPGLNVYDRHAYSLGCVFEVDGNGYVRITRHEFLRGEIVREPFELLPCGSDGYLATYNFTRRKAANKAPAFASDASISVKELSPTSIALTFDRAHDDNMVFSYEISVKNAANADIKCTFTAENGRDVYKADTYYYGMPDDFNDWANEAAMPKQKTLTIDFESAPAYPYTVSVKAYDLFGAYTPYNTTSVSEPITVTVTDPTQSNTAAAADFDSRVNALGSEATLTADSLDGIKAIRIIYAGLDYKVRARIATYDKFVRLEKYFYENVYVSGAVGVAPKAEDMAAWLPVSYKGSIEQTGGGITLGWNSATRNSLLGFAEKHNVDGMSVSFSSLTYDCGERSFGVVITGKKGGKYTRGECALIRFDMENGKVYFGKNTYLGRSANFVADKLGASPFSLSFKVGEDGSFNVTVTTVYGEETFTVSARHMAKLGDLPNTSRAYVYFTPWSSRQSISANMTAVNFGQ